jgi:hypothetical protein
MRNSVRSAVTVMGAACGSASVTNLPRGTFRRRNPGNDEALANATEQATQHVLEDEAFEHALVASPPRALMGG